MRNFVRIIKGEFKGYDGMIIEKVKDKFAIRIQANNRIVTLSPDQFIKISTTKSKSKGKNDDKTSSSSKKSVSRRSSSSGSFKSIGSEDLWRSGNSRSSTRSFDKGFNKGNFFENLEKKLKETQNPFLIDVSDFIEIADLEESFNKLSSAQQIFNIINNVTTLKNSQINKKLFVIAYFFVQLNKRNMQIPYKLRYKEIVAPNDNYTYILNVALMNKFIKREQVDEDLFKNYIDIILKSLNLEIIPAIQRAEVLDKIREKRAQIKWPSTKIPSLPKMKFFKRSDSQIKPMIIQKRNQIIQNYIDNIKSNKITIPADVDKNFIIEKLQDLLNKKENIRTPTISKNVDLNYLNSIINSIKIEERQIYNQLKFPDVEQNLKEDIKNKIKDLIITRINNQFYDAKTSQILANYVQNLNNQNYINGLSLSEKNIVEPYRRYFNNLVQTNLNIMPANLRKIKSSLKEINPVKKSIKEKLINLEKGRLRKLITKYPQHSALLEILVNNYNDYVVDLPFKDLSILDVDIKSGLFTDDELMLKMAQRELHSRLNELLTKNYQNLNFYSEKSKQKFL